MFSITRDTRRAAAMFIAFTLFALCHEVQAASLTGTPQTSVRAGSYYATRPGLNYTGTVRVTYQIANKPSWASFAKYTGKLSGTPTASHVGTYPNIVISATIGTSRIYWPAFTITVLPGTTTTANKPPVISGTPSGSILAGSAYAFQPVASDPERATLTFSIQNSPSWATFDTRSGRLSGTPSVAATHSNIVIAVSDGRVSASLPAFSIAVTRPNSAPVISGTPSMSTFTGTTYSFRPVASDADGNPLTFSVQNKPSWAMFDAATGQLSGIPTAAGQFANVTISVSDGTSTATLAPFTLTVSAVVVRTVTVHWVAPTQNVDGSPLVDLAGYRVHYGTTPTALNQVLELPNPDMTSVSIEELSSGTYYFAVKAYTAGEMESDLSEVQWKAVM
jgi:hypothetical protein